MNELGSRWRLEVFAWTALVGGVWWMAFHTPFLSWGSAAMAPLWAATALWHRHRGRRAVAEAYALGWRGHQLESTRDKQQATYFNEQHPVAAKAVREATRLVP